MNAARFENLDPSRIRPMRDDQVWSTTSVSGTPGTTPGELSDLGKHAEICKKQRGKLFTLRCVTDTLGAFLAPRVMTTMLVVALLIGVLAYL